MHTEWRWRNYYTCRWRGVYQLPLTDCRNNGPSFKPTLPNCKTGLCVEVDPYKIAALKITGIGSDGWKSVIYTLLQKKHNFSEPIFPGDPGSLTLTPGHVHFVKWKPASLNYTLRKKKCNFKTFLRGEFLLFYRYSNCKRTVNNFGTGFCTLLPRSWAKWNTLQSSSIYTLSKKKRNFPCCVSFEEECICY